MFQTTSTRTERKRALPLVIFPERRLPPLCLLPGQTPAKAREMSVRGKTAHIHPNFSQKSSSGNLLNARNARASIASPPQMGSTADQSPAVGVGCCLLKSSCGQRSARAAPGDGARSAHAGPAAIGESCGARCHEPASASCSSIAYPLDHGRYHTLSALAHHKTSHRGYLDIGRFQHLLQSIDSLRARSCTKVLR